MADDSDPAGQEIAGRLADEFRQAYGLGASFFRAAAARNGMTDTDIQVLDLLESTGEATAGQLANLMGLTTGTFTAILNRLEKAGLVRRERDPSDGRRVLVRRAPGAEGAQDPGSLFAALGATWKTLAADYDDAQQAAIMAFLQRGNMLAREEIARMRAPSGGDEGLFSTPLLDRQSARLVIHAEGVQVRLRAENLADALYRASFEGPVPDVKVNDGVVTIRYPKRLWGLGKEKRAAEVILSAAVPWRIALKGGGAEMTAALGGLDLLDLEANGAGSTFHVDLPEPARVVPIGLGGGGSAFTVRRPPGVAARVQLKGWGIGVAFDDQTMMDLGSARQVETPDYEGADRRYDIDMAGSGSMITVTAG